MIASLFAYIAAIVIVIGAMAILLAAVGVIRFPDLYTRLHAASMASAAGCGLILMAVMLTAPDISVALKALAAVCFLLLSTPVSSHLLAKVSHHIRSGMADITEVDELKPHD